MLKTKKEEFVNRVLWKQTKRAFCSLVGAGCLLLGGILTPQNAQATGNETAASSGIREVIGIADVFGDGEKISSVVLKYEKPIDARSVSDEDFQVDGKTVDFVCVNNRPELTSNDRPGSFVVLHLANANTAYDGDLAQKPGREKHDKPGRGTDAPRHSDRQPPDLSVKVRQTGTVQAIDGTVYAPSETPMAGTATREPVISSFQQFTYTDPATGNSMPYNLYLPESYDEGNKYPLLFFVADASANINDVRTPLFQGNGATVWAEPSWQSEHECIVLAPQYTADLVSSLGMMTTDAHEWTPGLSLVTSLLFDVIDRYSVDENRIYGTGQSQGGMANIAISDHYPELFAGQLLVACQWDVDEMEALKDKNLWIVVCEGDTKAFPGMNAATARWEALGTKVARNADYWDSKASPAETESKIKAMEAQGANINYSVFAKGNHMYTWSFAYDIAGLREWLFRQSAKAE